MDKPLPLQFSDDQLTQIFRAAAPLNPAERVAFLEDLAAAMRQANHNGAPGDGWLYRLIRETQRRHFDPPLDTYEAPRGPRGPRKQQGR